MKKIYYVKKHHRGSVIVIKGTIDKFVHNYFGYLLSCGHSWNPKIKLEPTTYKSLISNVNKSYDEKQGCCYERDWIEEATEEDYINAKNLGYNTSVCNGTED